jgi:hypothetical protein
LPTTDRLYCIDVIMKVEELKLDSNWKFIVQVNSLTVFKKLN